MSDTLAVPPPGDPGHTLDPEFNRPASVLTGMALIKDYVRRLPDAPGVYRMYGEGGESLYVGKARSLKKRVTHYATASSTASASATWSA
jgi:hypothetical protein